jgi:hypothetical protein
MLDFKRLFISLLAIIAIAIANGLMFISPVIAATQSFQISGATGYSVKGTFSYDETKNAPIISEQGAGKTSVLDSLVVTFYSPEGEPIRSYENVADGIAKGKYFEFNFDTINQKLLGNIDLGGEFIGETYLKGKVDKKLSLFQVEESGNERIIDQVARYR